MKKLNRKGFTLIELLAVIVILAIVMVVTIPSVINAMNGARSGQLKNAADSVAEWLTKNYELSQYSASLGTGTTDKQYSDFMNGKSWSTTASLDIASVLEAAGVSDASKNISTAYAKLGSNNKICVTLTAGSDGSFYVNGATNKATSAGCSEVAAPTTTNP